MRARAAALALLLAAPLPAAAGELRLEGEAGWSDLTAARDAAQAVFGSSRAPGFGAAVSYGASGSGPFGRISARYVERSGERVFAVDRNSPVFRLGHPLELRLVPVYGLVGWRVSRRLVSPYLGIGAGVTFYRETSTVAEVTTSTRERYFSMHAALGAEALHGPLRVGIELGWSRVPDALGAGGISERFSQTDAGGLSATLRLVFVP